jgi:outer membrane lipoprotein-sorting protein
MSRRSSLSLPLPRPLFSRRAALLGLGALALLPARRAQAALAPDDQADIERIQYYLNGIHTLASRFDQVADDGGIASGTIYLQRPGHMRIEYDQPSRIVMVATRGEIFYYDGKLDQVSWVDIDQTPAWFLLQNDIRIGGDIQVLGLQRDPGVLKLTLTETKRATRGRVTLVLSDQPLELRQWSVVDAQNKTVTVTLADPHYGAAIDPKEFVWSDPRENNGH